MTSAIRRLQKRTVVVHLLSGVSVQGVLRRTYRDGVVLSHVRHLDRDVDLEGEIVVPKASIDYYQAL